MSLITKLIDEACGYDRTPKKRVSTDHEKEMARDIACAVIGHIDEMYPAMWEGVPKSARNSVKNTVINNALQKFIEADSQENDQVHLPMTEDQPTQSTKR